MAPPEALQATTLQEYTALIQERQLRAGGSLWYRGACSTSHTLLPTLYRHPSYATAQEFSALEQQILTRFKQRSIPYLTRYITGDWDYLFLMQHYGVPTRLLDWSENPYVALYFALTKIVVRDQDHAKMQPAAIWLLNPVAWNQKALSHITFTGGILSIDDDLILGYAPGSSLGPMNNEPVAIFGAYNSPRIVAQRGAFVIFGKSFQPMEILYEEKEYPEGSLTKIEIPPEFLSSVHASLIDIGIVSSVIFPDLDGLAMELRWHFGFRR